MNWTSYRLYLLLSAALVLGAVLGIWLWGGDAGPAREHQDHAQADGKTWTCSMHPQIQRAEPGQCPICGMDLVPRREVSGGEGDGPAGALTMSKRALELAELATEEVREELPEKLLRLSGYVRVDSGRVARQAAHVAGRVEQLAISRTGQRVRKGQEVAKLYSPEWVTAQQELIAAYQDRAERPRVWAAMQAKLRQWKVPRRDVLAIARSGKARDYFTVRAEQGGWVTRWGVKRGDYVKRGQALYGVASGIRRVVWLELYPEDWAMVRVGDSVELRQGRHGESLAGAVDWVDPQVDAGTGLGRARVAVGLCDWPVGSRAVGRLEARLSEEPVLTVPKSAVLWTGERSVVFVPLESEGLRRFGLQRVRLGADLGGRYVVESGLAEGDRVVHQGVFSLDAAAQLRGLPSMMQGEAERSAGRVDVQLDWSAIADDGRARSMVRSFVKTYLKIKEALVADSLPGVKQAAREWGNAYAPEAGTPGAEAKAELRAVLQAIAQSQNLEEARLHFRQMTILLRAAGAELPLSSKDLYLQFCPMAKENDGAYWLSEENVVLNPYFGASMLHCGEVRDTIFP